MPLQVINSAQIMCSMGTMPSQLVVLPVRLRNATSQPAATIMDHAPMVNIPPFGLCMSPAFPATASATAAASGVLTPMPCIPSTPAPWAPGSPIVKISSIPALRQTDTCQCIWGGTISILNPGQVVVTDA